MTRLFDERERAAENRYAHDEELNFLARRRGIQMLARWAAESMSLDAAGALDYEARLVDAFVGGMSDDRLVESVQHDLERAGKPTMVMHVAPLLAQSIAEASLALRGGPAKPPPQSSPESPREAWSRHHPKTDSSWGWGL